MDQPHHDQLGIMAACTAAVKTPSHFYTVRFLLGLAEAGFFPGVIVYMAHWFPKRERAKALAGFFIAGPIAFILGPNISRLMIDIGTPGHPTFLGMQGWQIIYIFWGIPAVIMGVVVLFTLTDRPRQATWLTDAERSALENELQREREGNGDAAHMRIIDGLKNPTIVLMALAYFGVNTANYGVDFFLPKILSRWYGHDYSGSTILFFGSLPYIAMLAGQIWIGRRSDRTGERWLHAAVPLMVGALVLTLAPWSHGLLPMTLAVFGLTLAGIRGLLPAFWALPGLLLQGTAAAGAIGFINSFGNLGGYLGSRILGKGSKLTGSYDIGLYILAACGCLSALIIFGLARAHRRNVAATAAATREPAVVG